MQQNGFTDLVADLHDWIERVHGALENNRHLLPAIIAHLAFAEGQHVETIIKNLSASNAPVGRQQAHDRHQGGCLAAARFTDQTDGLSGGDIKGNILQGSGGLAVRHDEIYIQVAD